MRFGKSIMAPVADRGFRRNLGTGSPFHSLGASMDEQAQLKEVLEAVRNLLPSSVITTCESLNGHGEWEIALSHCLYHLKTSNIQLSTHTMQLIEACEARFRNGSKQPCT